MEAHPYIIFFIFLINNGTLYKLFYPFLFPLTYILEKIFNQFI